MVQVAPGWARSRLPPVVLMEHTISGIYTALSSASKGSGRRSETVSQQAGPSADARYRQGRGVGEGSSGGKARAWDVHIAQRCKRAGTEVGIRTSPASHLVVVLEISQILVWKSASRFGDLKQGQAVSRGLQRE